MEHKYPKLVTIILFAFLLIGVMGCNNYNVSGITLDDNLKPLTDVKVYVSDENQPHREVISDAGGRFKIDGLHKGRVTIGAERECPSWWYGMKDEFNAGNNDVEIYMKKVQLGREPMALPKNSPPSLIGTALPDLKELGIQLPNKDIDGKQILVCFWEVWDEESRDYIRQLASRNKELAEKNVVIIGAQTWYENIKQCHRWWEKNHVKFPVSILPDPWEQIPEERPIYRWGVQNRVPWLILTDSKHTVQAEGFRLDELDKKIREN